LIFSHTVHSFKNMYII